MTSCKFFLLIFALVALAGAASIDSDDAPSEVHPREKSSPAIQPASEMSKMSDNEPPGNPSWWQKAKAWFAKHTNAAKEWAAKLVGSKEGDPATGTQKPTVATSENAAPPAGNPGWWQKTKHWFSGLFGSRKTDDEKDGKASEKKIEKS